LESLAAKRKEHAMKNITLALAITLGFCATEAGAQARTRTRTSLLNRPAAVQAQPDIVLFDAQKAMPYADAAEKAKENNPEAYYWLSYYFSKGGEVNKDGKVAWKFLLKADELGCSEASRAVGRIHEMESLKKGRNRHCSFAVDWSTDDGRSPLHSFDVDYRECKQLENGSWTNETATTYVESFYNKAIKGGIEDATNDLARLHKKIVDAKARIEKEKEDRRKAEEKKKEEKRVRDENSAKALALLPPEKPKEEVQPKGGRSNLLGGRMGSLRERRALRAQQEAAEANLSPEEKAERELWSTWPEDISWDDSTIIKACSEKLNVVISGWDEHGKICYGGIDGGWTRGCGKCLLDGGDSGVERAANYWVKYDSSGTLVKAGSHENFEEYIWMTNRAACVTIENQKQWAQEHGMSYDEAVLKFAKLSDKVHKFRREKRLAEMAAELQKQREAAEKRGE